MTTNQKPTSPLLGWMSAGADLVSEQVEHVTGMVSKQIDATHALFEELQQRGEPVDEQLRQTLSPSSMVTSLQTLVMANPLFSLFSGNKKAAAREQQLAVLSAKVDLLVEQVALLAAKKAEQQKKARSAAKTSNTKTAPKKAAASKSSPTKSTASASTKTTTKSASKAASKPATRKRSTSSSKGTSSSGSRASSSATKKAD